MIHVKSLKMLRKLRSNNKVGDLASTDENGNLYRWDGTSWQTYRAKNIVGATTLYEMNKSAMKGIPALSEETIQEKKQLFIDYIKNNPSNYFMLLNRETYDITVLKSTSNDQLPTVEDNVIELLLERGEIKDISKVTGAIECWITNKDNSKVYYFFDYSEGVVECR